jgi:polysaccharide biosynthesis/export protein
VLKKEIFVKLIIIFLVICSFSAKSFGQEGDFVQSEMIKIQEEFTTDRIVTPETTPLGQPSELNLPQEDLIRELAKPGNENLLEQIKQSGKQDLLFELENKLESQKNQEQKDEEQRKKIESSREEEEKKLKTARTTLEGLLFEDNYAYYQSVKEFFGYDVFLKTESKAKESTVLSNDNYVLGPGDELVMTLWGDTEMQRNLKISEDGTVYIREIGIISVHGYKMSEINDRMKKILSKSYSTIDPPDGNPTTFFDVSLKKLKSINVFVNGEVIVPGSFSLSSHSTILDALKAAKGVSARGTLREIALIREGKVIIYLDIYDYLMTGMTVNDINLKNGDNIFVGPRLSTVHLYGEVMRSLKYELKDNENLSDLIKYSGGILVTAAIDRLSIERIMPMEERRGPVVTTKILDIEYTHLINGKIEVKPIKLFNHDIIVIHQVPKILSDFVAIGGAVYRKGRYHFEDGMTVSDLLIKAGGLLSDAFTQRVELIRMNPNSSTEYFSLDISKGDDNFKLSQRDSIFIHSEWNLKSKKIVMLSGYIDRPGFYFLSDSMKVSDLIFSKGGLEDEKKRNRTYMKRADLIRFNDDGLTTRIIPINLDKLVERDKTEDILLQDRDHLRIYGIGIVFTEPRVKITGYVRYEGEYPLSEKMTVEDLIMKAHGYKEGALMSEAVVFRLKKDRFETDSLSQVFNVKIDDDFLETGKISKRDFFLQDNDHVVIRKHPDFENIRKITLSGEVKFPGVYNLTFRHETLKDIIERAGGLTQEAFLEGTVFQRDSIRIVTDFKKATTSSSVKLIMKDRDDVHIPKRPGLVSVEGFVYSPQKIAYRSDWSLSDYVEAAGGPVKDVKFIVGETVVYYPGGNAEVDGWFFSPDVKEGSRIVVERVEKEPDSKWREEVRSWLGILTSTITILLLISKLEK